MQRSGWGGRTSLTANGKSSHAKSSSTIFQTPNNMETSENLPRQITLDELISLQGDSPASPTAPQEKEKEKKTNATSGRRCLELFESVRPVGSWERTFAGLLIGTGDWFSKRCALTWKLVGTPYNRLFFQLAPSTLPTDVTECGLLLTPTTTERSEHPDEMRARAEAKGYRNGTKYNSLTSQILYGNFLPTPVAQDCKGIDKKSAERKARGETRPSGAQIGSTLRNDIRITHNLFPTPTTSDYKGGRKKETLEASGRGATNSLPDAFSQHGKTSQLNPHFVEEMMGFPKGWTVSPFQSGEENQSKPTETR